MSDDPAPKSAYELAMERLRKKDEDAGVTHQAVTDAQKAAIAETRNFYESKIAELEVLHQGTRRRATDLAEVTALDEAYRRDRDRLVTERDAKIEKIRKGG